MLFLYLKKVYGNNSYMEKLIKEIRSIKDKIHLNVLAAANTYYLLLLMVPFYLMGFDLKKIKISYFIEIFAFGIVFFIDCVYVVSRYLNNLRLTSDILYDEVPVRNKTQEFIKTIIMTIFLLIFVGALVFVSYLAMNYINLKNYLIYKIIEYGVAFIIILFITTIVYKYTLPVYISFKKSFNISVVLSIVWVMMSAIYGFLEIYLENVMIRISFTLFFLYVLNYIIILSFIYNYVKTKNTN